MDILQLLPFRKIPLNNKPTIFQFLNIQCCTHPRSMLVNQSFALGRFCHGSRHLHIRTSPMTSLLGPVQARKPTELLRETAKQTTQKLSESDNYFFAKLSLPRSLKLLLTGAL